ncbi:D-glycero-alpha-D-manno-heptose-1,7-bisphosphate 7-phosphatase [Streptomyces caelestis]|uniref:D-glycero-alpha-D-manno-heptose-1,7-bisphosphate 7-phosphatase n=1 Tax=Streptomyces caelestis TaxID=36816 RepID=UPI003654E3B9
MSPVRAVLFDRDGTLVHDVPYNADPDLVRPVDGAREALDALRARGIRTGVVTNQSGIARGLLTEADARRVNRRVDELLGPFDVWAVCPHGPGDGCPCRKPRPGMILRAAGRIRVRPADCVVVGDIGADVEAARRAGARAVLVPTPETRPEETSAAPHVAPDLSTAVRLILDTPPWDEPADIPPWDEPADIPPWDEPADPPPPTGPASAGVRRPAGCARGVRAAPAGPAPGAERPPWGRPV